MTQSNKRWSIGVQIIIMVAFIGVFLAGIALIGGGFEARGPRFWVTLISIVFAQLVWFNVPIWMVASDARRKDSFPFQFTAITFCTMYAAAVFLMALTVLFTEIPSDWVVLGHLVLLFLFATSLGIYSMAGRAIDQMDAADKRDKAGYQQLALHIQSVADRASVVGSAPASEAISELHDAIRYATGESVPGSEGADAEIVRHLSQVEGFLVDLESPENEEAGQSLVDQIVREVKLAKLAVERRERLVASLR